MNITIRSLTPSDFHQVYEVAKRSWLFTYKLIFSEKFITAFVKQHYSPDALQKHLEWVQLNGGWSTIVETDNNKIIGFCFIGPFKETLWRLWRIYLDPDYIGQGIGTQILEAGEEFLKRSKILQYLVFVHPKNQIAIEFYKRRGFTPISPSEQEERYGIPPAEERGFIKNLKLG